jgi:hypothetical protein
VHHSGPQRPCNDHAHALPLRCSCRHNAWNSHIRAQRCSAAGTVSAVPELGGATAVRRRGGLVYASWHRPGSPMP